jgi:cell division protein FtsI (penicillin-binding protein 3)
VVSAEGTGPHAAVPGYVVAGKTGTTEVYDIEARGYSKTKHIASFVGFVPADDPAVTILVMVERPRKGRYGGVVAAPVFSRIARRALPLLGLWPPEGVRRAGVELAQQARPGRAH